MAIKSGETTYHQAKRGIVQNGLVLNLDAGVDASYNGGTTWRDLAGSNDGSLVNMNNANLTKDNGGVFTFGGTNEYVQIDQDVSDNDTRTLTGWVNMESAGVTLISCCRVSGSSTSQTKISTEFNSDGDLVAIVQDHSGIAVATCAANLNVWLHVTAVFTRSYPNWTADLYLNGSLQSTDSGSSTSSLGINQTLVGLTKRQNGAEIGFADGKISNTSIYSRALTATEITQNYNVTRHRFGV